MKPRIKLAESMTASGGAVGLYERDGAFSISFNGQELMHSQSSASERLLGELAAERLRGADRPRVLIGGLGLGFTLRRALELLPPKATVEVAELLPAIVAWNRSFLHGLNGAALDDPRVSIIEADVGELIRGAEPGRYDAMALDVDNGPIALVEKANDRLYSLSGLLAAKAALAAGGRAVFWSAGPDAKFELRLRKAGFRVKAVPAKTHDGAKRAAYILFAADAPKRTRGPIISLIDLAQRGRSTSPMSLDFEELDYRPTPIGDLMLRRRRMPQFRDLDIFEIKLGEFFLMSSLFHEAEEQLAKLGIAETPGDRLDVVVGGLGLGYTAVAALDEERVDKLVVVEFLEGVIDWHRRGLVPLGKSLSTDQRCRIEQADFFELASKPGAGFDPLYPGRKHDAILLDIDHTPTHVLNQTNTRFYTEEGLAELTTHLKPGGVFALWSDGAPEEEFTDHLRKVFATAEGHKILFDNPILGGYSCGTVYVAKTRG